MANDFNNDWNAALRQQSESETKEARSVEMSSQRQVFDGYRQLADQMGMEQRAANDTRGNAIASMMKFSQSQGGIPRSIMGALNRDLGFDGKNQSLVDAGMAKNGTFVMCVAKRDPQTGRVGVKNVTFDPMQRYKIMLSKPGIFNRNEVGAMAVDLNRRFGYKESEIPVPDNTYWDGETAQMDPEDRIGTRTPEGAVRVRGSWLTGPEKRGGSSFSADGKGGFTRSVWDGRGNRISQDGGTRAEGDTGRWKVLRSGFISDQDDYGTVYENDKTGETAFVRRGETPPWQKNTTGTDKIAIEQMKQDGLDRRAENQNKSRERVAEMGNTTRIDLAKLTGEQRKELNAANNILKKYGIDIGYKKSQERNESNERIAAEREKGRQSRSVLRDKQAWEKLAIEREKVDKNFAVQMKRADTYGKRIDLIEQKIYKDYEIARKKVENEEERLALDEAYKKAKLDLEEGRLDLDWLKVDSAAEQKELDRQNNLKIAELRAKATSAGKSRAVTPSRLKEINAELDAYGKILKGPYDEENRRKASDGIARLAQELSLNGGKKSHDGTTKVKPGDTTGNGTTTANPSPTLAPKEGDRKQFKQGWGVFRNGKWVLEGK